MTSQRILPLCFAASVLAAFLPAQGPAPRDPRVASYVMAVELLPQDRLIVGTQRIAWTNTASQAVSELRFHLYINAFRDLDSTFMRESDAAFRALWRPHEFGSITLEKIELVAAGSAVDLTAAQRFVQPDDGNAADATVVAVELPAPVGPGETVELRTAFRTRLPKAYSRTGWVPDDGFFCMQWFPKLGVLQDGAGGPTWNCHQFHANTEFFADFASYEVEITLPPGFKVGATGERNPDRQLPDQRVVASFAQNQPGTPVHDFAWVADPDFVRYEDTFDPTAAAEDPVASAVAARLGLPAADLALPPTKIVLLLQPEHDTERQRTRHFDAVKIALRFFGQRFGAYPYGTITVVDPGRDVMGRPLGGGMEYPNLITCGTDLFPHPRRLAPEGVTVHEFGHQYWYGLSANDELEESWLDEGLDTYCAGRAVWLAYASTRWPVQTTRCGELTLAGTPGPLWAEQALEGGCRIPFLGALPAAWRRALDDHHFAGAVVPDSPLLDVLRWQPTATFFREVQESSAWSDRNAWLRADTPDALVRRGWEYLDRASYVANSYHRPATLLHTMERMVGRDAWWTFLRRFHAQARFRHPTTQDFVRLCEESCGAPASDFFTRATAAEARLDYGVHSIHPADGGGDTKEVVIRRYGNLPANVVVRFRFAERSEPVYREVRAADLYPWTKFTFVEGKNGERYGRLLEVWVDPPIGTPGTGEAFEQAAAPAGVYLLDENLLNNAWRSEPDHAPALHRGIRLLLEAQSRLSFAGLIG